MAKKKKKINQKKLIKKKSKPNFISGLKELTNFLVYPNKKIETLENIVNTYQFDEFIFKRLLSYIYSYPHLIYYWNKYMNNLFSWNILFGSKENKRKNIIKLINSLKFTIIKNNFNDKRKFLYIKSNLYQEKNRTVIKKLLKEYFITIYNKFYNNDELNFFYKLFCENVITDVELMKIDQLLNNGKNKLNSNVFIKPNITETPVIHNESNINISKNNHSDEIKDIINKIKKFKINREECKKCGLYNSPMVVLDTNIKKVGSIDVLFIGLNPGINEVKEDLPFVGVSGKKLRSKMALLPKDIKWAITNIVLCHTKSEKEIPENAFINCSQMFKNICELFPAKYYVFIGRHAAQLANIKGNITSVSGKLFNNKIIPIVHPSSLRSEKMINIWNKSFETIYNLFNVNNNYERQDSSSNQNLNYNIPQEKIITSISDDLTFFDVKDIGNNQLVKIFIDSNGIKKYYFEDYKYEINLKNQPFFKCKMIDNKMDHIIQITGSKKYYISKLLRDSLKNVKEESYV